MSEPMTNVEIEDVLSSIRRLVAEGDHDKAAVSQPAAPRSIGKLVLTPAFRIDTPEPATVEPPVLLQDSARVENDAKQQDVPGQDRASLLATIAELEAAVRGQPDDWEPDGTGTDTDLSWARAGFRGDVPVEDAEEIADPPPAASRSAGPSAWPATLVEAARLYGGNEADDDASPAQFQHHPSENIAQPDDDGDSDFHDDLIGGPNLDDDAEDMLDSYLAGDAIIDEELLRDMVRDIVRQELQGKLGERITRNVRKLVRREIHRALTTQNLD